MTSSHHTLFNCYGAELRLEEQDGRLTAHLEEFSVQLPGTMVEFLAEGGPGPECLAVLKVLVDRHFAHQLNVMSLKGLLINAAEFADDNGFSDTDLTTMLLSMQCDLLMRKIEDDCRAVNESPHAAEGMQVVEDLQKGLDLGPVP